MNKFLESKIAYLDLSNKTVTEHIVQASDFYLYLGGRGLGAKLLFQGQPKGVDPFGPDNQLIFLAGKLVGTPAPTAGQLTITSLSPATGFYFKSNTGGIWARNLKRAGWDAIVIKGISDKPVFVSIDDHQIQYHDASGLWGLTIREADKELRRILGGKGWDIASIGPAGENLVRYASIMTSLYHAAGRGGLGAVMGAKKLKAIAVHGTGKTEVVDWPSFHHEILEILNKVRNNTKAQLYLEYGTAATIEMANEGSSLPVNNFSRNRIEDGHKISGTYLVEKEYMFKGAACSACPMGCHKHSKVKTDFYKGHSGGPEYETLASLGATCGITDPEAVLKGNELCNDFGLDTISVGGAIGWLIESIERGVLGINDVDGMEISWGNGKAMVELIHRIVSRKGIGDLLAEGTRQAAEKIGGDSWRWAVQAHGLEQSRVDIRGAKAYALAFAVNPRGPDHLHAQPQAEFGRHPEARKLVKRLLGSDTYCDATSTEGKPEIVRWHEDLFAVTDSLGLCSFATTTSYVIDIPCILRMLRSAFGSEFSEEDLLKIGQRTVVLERCINLREDPNRKDMLPWRMMNQPISEGPKKGEVISEKEIKELLRRYYELQGYDPKTGNPTPNLLHSLGLLNDIPILEKTMNSIK
jgi:aldehyde:ferredoxin oxidoreductase